jgi:D-3-phosphoglycerate dehydrogenase
MFSIAEGGWLKTADGSNEVRKKKLGIVGYGNIGAQLSVLASAFGMHVYYYDIEPKLAHGNARAMDSLDALLTQCDVVTLHVPATPRTANMMTRERIMRDEAGRLSDQSGARQSGGCRRPGRCAEVRPSGRCGGRCLPGGAQEQGRSFFESPLQDCPNVILTPHIGGSTAEAQQAIGLDAATKLAKFLHEGATSFAVNFPQVEPGPVEPGRTRLVVPHENRPGFLRRQRPGRARRGQRDGAMPQDRGRSGLCGHRSGRRAARRLYR